MVYAGFREPRRDIPDPPPAQSGLGSGPEPGPLFRQLSGSAPRRRRRSWAGSRERGARPNPSLGKSLAEFCQKLEYALHTNMTNMQKYAPPTLLMVPPCLAAAVAPSVAEATEAGCLICSPRRSCARRSGLQVTNPGLSQFIW